MKALILSSMSICFIGISASARLDQVAPVPPEVRVENATLTIKGEPGAGQKDEFTIYKFTEVNGHPMNGSDEFVSSRSGCEACSFKLGDKAQLLAGTYKILYGGAFFVIRLAPKEDKVIELQKLNIPHVDGTYKFEAFMDLTKADVQDSFLRAVFSKDLSMYFMQKNPVERITPVKYCSVKASRPVKDFCAAILGTDYKQLRNAAIKFNSAGSFRELGFNFAENNGSLREITAETKFGPETFLTVGQGQDGDFVSVLPGTYAIRYTNLKGESTTMYGIVVR